MNSDPDKPGPTLVLHRRPLVILKDKIGEQRHGTSGMKRKSRWRERRREAEEAQQEDSKDEKFITEL